MGGAKIFRAKPLKDQFHEFGLTTKHLVLVGVVEVLGGIAIQIPLLSTYAAIGLLLTLFGAMYNHWKVKHPINAYVPAIVLGLFLLAYLILSFYSM